MSGGTVVALSIIGGIALLAGVVELARHLRARRRGGYYPMLDPFEALVAGVVCIVITLIVWAICAWPVSAYQQNSCEETARGYGLDPAEIDWSYRYGCRVALPSGQLIPEGRIRITSNGEIIVADEED